MNGVNILDLENYFYDFHHAQYCLINFLQYFIYEKAFIDKDQKKNEVERKTNSGR